LVFFKRSDGEKATVRYRGKIGPVPGFSQVFFKPPCGFGKGSIIFYVDIENSTVPYT
jgi:hypothetical protein